MTTALVAEDMFLLRDGMIRLLEAYDFEIVAAVDSGTGLAYAMTELRPDVSILDVRLPPSFADEGLRAAVAARGRIPGLPVLILSQYVERLYARELLADRGGAVGYLLKDRVFDSGEFIDTVRRVGGGATVIDPEVVAQLVASKERSSLETLTPREREVLELMAGGRSNLAIAEQLTITERAVAKHTANIFGKLSLEPDDDTNRRVLAVLAYLDGRA